MAKKIKAFVLDNYGCCREPWKVIEVEGIPYTYNNVNFIIVKGNRNYTMYETYTGLTVVTEGTIKKVKEEFEKKMEFPQAKQVLENINTLPSLPERIAKQTKYWDLDKKFTKLTGKALPIGYGVDVIRFSDMEGITTIDGISLAEHVEKKYGKEARAVLEEMVNMGIVE